MWNCKKRPYGSGCDEGSVAAVKDDWSRIVRTAGIVALLSAGGCAASGAGSGAPWTILCLELRDPAAAQQVEQIAETLRRTPGIRAGRVFVMNDPGGGARLYYGRYYRRTDPKTGRRSIPAKMRDDLSLLRQLGDEAGRRYFGLAMPVRVPVPDVGNPEWVLATLPAKYSLQVAVFEATDYFTDYKKAGAEYCKWLRERGYQAYYHHGSASSMVTVGSFGLEAVIQRPGGHTYYSNEVLALQRDEILKYNLVNGAILRVRNDDGVMVAVPSMLVEIPHPTDAGVR